MASTRNLHIQFTGDTKELEKALKRSGVAANKFGDKMQRVGKKMTSLGKSMTKSVTLPIVAIGVVSVKAFGDFDKAMNESIAIMGKVSKTMKTKMAKTAKDVAKTTTFSAKEAAGAYFFLASAGLDAAESIGALPKVAAFAQAGNFDMALATDLLTDAQSALGLSVDDTAENMENMTRVSDVLVKANTIANATVAQFSESLTNKAGAALRVLGKDVEEGAAVLAVFADQGVKGADAGTQLGIVLRDLQTKAIKNKDEFKKFNIEVFDAEGNMNNMADVTEDLEKALDGMSDETIKATLLTLGFSDKSIAAMMALLGTSEAMRGYEEDLRSAGGLTQEVADKQLETFNNKMKIMRDKLEIAAIGIGEILVPMVIKLANKISRLVAKFEKLEITQQENIVKFAAILAIGGPLTIVMGQLAIAIGAVSKALAILGLSLGPLVVVGALAVAGKLAMDKLSNAINTKLTNAFDNVSIASDKLRRRINEIIVRANILLDIISRIPGIPKIVIPTISGVQDANVFGLEGTVPFGPQPPLLPTQGPVGSVPSIPTAELLPEEQGPQGQIPLGIPSQFKFGDGIIANKPTFGVFGEAGPEAVVPLKNGKLQVEGGGTTVIIENLNLPGVQDSQDFITELQAMTLEASIREA